MSKRFKSIVTAFLMAVMLVNSSVSAMAAENVRDVANTSNQIQNADSTDIVVTRASALASFEKSTSLTEGKNIGSVYIPGRAKTVQWTVAGSGGNVIFRMVNRSTGDTRSFTTVGNGVKGSLTYISAMDSGTWDISVIYASGNGHNHVYLTFYS